MIASRWTALFADPTVIAELEQREAERIRNVAAAKARKKAEMIAALELPALALQSIKSPASTEAIQATSNVTGIVIIAGGPGTGKTVAAVRWIVDAIDNDCNWAGNEAFSVRYIGRPPMFVTASSMARWGRYSDDAMARLMKSCRLAVDDLGVEMLDGKGAFQSLLDEVINYRYSNRIPTLITTNLAKDEILPRYGARIADRLREVGKFCGTGAVSMRVKK